MRVTKLRVSMDACLLSPRDRVFTCELPSNLGTLKGSTIRHRLANNVLGSQTLSSYRTRM